MCLSVIESVFFACEAPGSPSLVVESSETGGVKSGASVCCSSRYSSSENRVAQPVVQRPRGISHSCTAALSALLLLLASIITSCHRHIQLSQAKGLSEMPSLIGFHYVLSIVTGSFEESSGGK